MNTADYVDKRIEELLAMVRDSGMSLSEAVFTGAKLCVGWPYIFGDRGQYCTPAHRQAVYNKNPNDKARQNVRKACQAIRADNPTGSCSGCKWYPGGKKVRGFDCRGFTYWILLQIFGWELQGTGCTKQWNNAANWKQQGTVAEGIPQDVIVCLFYRNEKDPNVIEHTGLYYNGQTVECSKGVQHSKTLNAKWEMWGIPACVSGDTPTPTPPDPDKRPTLRKGDSGAYVVELQTDLVRLGYNLGTYGPEGKGIDGKFGQKTQDAVKDFQRAAGLTADGICGPLTWAALEAPDIKVYTVHIPQLPLYKAEAIINQYPGAWMTTEGGNA